MAGNFYMGNPGQAPTSPLRPGNEGTGGATPPPSVPPSNVLPGQGIRPTGQPQGYDPAYLQNLATYVGGLFANPGQGGNLNFNPLGNLSDISPSSGMMGNAPNPGQPVTWLQQALAGLPFSGTQPTSQATPGGTQGTSVPTSRPPVMGGPRNPMLPNGL